MLTTLTGGPAADAGIREGDVIVEVDGKPIDVAADLGRVLDGLKPGDAVDVKVIGSSGQERTTSVTLGTKPLPTEFLQP